MAGDAPKQKTVAERHADEISAIVAESEAGIAPLKPFAKTDPVAARKIAEARAACSAAIRTACDRHRVEANAPLKKPAA